MDDAHASYERALRPLISEFASDPEMAEMVEYFCAEVLSHVATLNDALDRRALDELRVHAHRLKGSAGGYGYPTISESAGLLERMLIDETDDPAALGRQVDELVDLCRRAAAARTAQ